LKIRTCKITTTAPHTLVTTNIYLEWTDAFRLASQGIDDHTMSHGSDEGDNYWPGYVDALTSMVQVLAFVMMMLAMAVFVLSQSVAKHAVEAIAKAVNAEVKPNADVKELTQAVMDQLKRMTLEKPAGEASQSAPSAEAPVSKQAARADAENDPGREKIVGMRISSGRSHADQATLDVPPDAPRMTLGFEDHSFKIEQARVQSMAKFVDDNKVVERSQTVVINAFAYSGDGALSEARRLAYYRAMMARKQLVDAKVRAATIRINVNDTADKDKGSTVEMIVAR